MKRYIGYRDAEGVTQVLVTNEEGQHYPLPHEVRHSPTGFEWGYLGSGPADLARCLLLDALPFEERYKAEGLYQYFKQDVVQYLYNGPVYVTGPYKKQPTGWANVWAMTDTMLRGWVEGRMALPETAERVATFRTSYEYMEDTQNDDLDN
jgi:hypothetical protein